MSPEVYSAEIAYVVEMMRPLEGGRIINISAAVDDDGDVYPEFTILKDGVKTVYEVWRDGEGNGPGVIHRVIEGSTP